ncbi:hypothetical protein G3O06_15720 [Burkholderia sp. Ac-20345]|nr:hypothetical protein [Burkholderia sp. Ac-20345]
MASESIRDRKKDYSLTPQNAASIVIDYQQPRVNIAASMSGQLLVNKIVDAAKAAIVSGSPIVYSTDNVKSGLNQPPIP